MTGEGRCRVRGDGRCRVRGEEECRVRERCVGESWGARGRGDGESEGGVV